MSEPAAIYEVGPAPKAGSIPCGYCLQPFTPAKPWAKYCSTACRTGGNARRAAEGVRARVSSTRVLKGGGVSVVLHFPQAERERALKLEPGKLVGVMADA